MAYFFFLLYLVVLYIRPAEWIGVFRGWQLADITLLGTMFFLVFEQVATRRGLIKVPHTRLLVGLLLAMVLSHAAHTYIEGIKLAITGFAPVVIMYYLTINTVTTGRRLQVALWMVVLLTAVLAWQGIYQFDNYYGWAGQKMALGHRITWISIFNDPNDLALAFVIVVPVLLSYLVKPIFVGLKIIPLALLGLLIYGVYLTNSRGGILGLMVTIAFFFIKRSRWVVPGGILGGAMATLVFLFGPSRLGLMAASDASAQGRLESWYYGFQLIKANPLFGVGHNMFTNDYPLTAHNSFILAAAELGIIGLCCWVGLLYTSFKSLSLVQKHARGPLAHHAYALQAALIGFAATTLFLSRTYNELPYLLCALSASLYYVAVQGHPEVAFQLRGKDYRNIVILSLGSLGLAQVAMKTWL